MSFRNFIPFLFIALPFSVVLGEGIVLVDRDGYGDNFVTAVHFSKIETFGVSSTIHKVDRNKIQVPSSRIRMIFNFPSENESPEAHFEIADKLKLAAPQFRLATRSLNTFANEMQFRGERRKVQKANDSEKPSAENALVDLNGKKYLNARLQRVEPDGLLVSHTAGVTKVFFTDLPKAIRDQYGYDPIEAAEFSRLKKAGAAEQERHDVVTEVRSAPESNNASLDAEKTCREIARNKWPNDQRMQNPEYEQQMSAYRYMVTAANEPESRAIALGEWPNDFTMQKFEYDKQFAAKTYMAGVVDTEVTQFALSEWPNDFAMQKFEYDKQLAAKNYMANQANGAKKSQAISEYPNDYSMQKFVFDN